MNILSININQLLKDKNWSDKTLDKEELMRECMLYLLEYINQSIKSKEDILFINEMPYYSYLDGNIRRKMYKEFVKLVASNNYKIIKPASLYKRRPNFITCAITLNESIWQANNIHMKLSNYKNKYGQNKDLYYNRCVEITNGDIHILGVHIPASSYEPSASVLWDDIYYFCKEYLDKKIIIIGDMNVDKEGTIQKRKFNEIISLGFKDTWLEKGQDPNHATHRTSRLDYALVSSHITVEKYDVKMDDSTRIGENKFTDHSALHLKIKTDT